MDKNIIRCRHMLEAIAKIELYTAGLTYEAFINDSKTFDATIRALEIIGEAARNVDEDFRSRYTSILWREIADFRNVLIHQYFGVDERVVWGIVHKELPQLKADLQGLV